MYIWTFSALTCLNVFHKTPISDTAEERERESPEQSSFEERSNHATKWRHLCGCTDPLTMPVYLSLYLVWRSSYDEHDDSTEAQVTTFLHDNNISVNSNNAEACHTILLKDQKVTNVVIVQFANKIKSSCSSSQRAQMFILMSISPKQMLL